MDVILRQTVPDLGTAGDLVTVRDGYARNYLLPRGLAYVATEANRRRAEAEAKRRVQLEASERSDAEALAARIAEQQLTFTAKAGEGDKLFGSITSADIASRLEEQAGIGVDKRAIELEEPLKMVGVYAVPIKLHPEVRAEVRVWVVKE